MKKVIFFSLLAFLNMGMQAQNKTTFFSDDDPATEAAILKLEMTLVDLLQKGDFDTYSGYLTDDYIRVSASGEVFNKEQVLQAFRASGMKSMMKPHDMDVRVYGNTAILNGVLDMEMKDGSSKTSSYITKVFVRKDGQWYLASMQGTGIDL
jgi:ketosteroid isomerase-like protein